MTLDLGDEAVSGATIQVPLPANSAGVAGDAVTWDSSNDRVDATDATGESVFGVLAEDAPSSAGGIVSVVVHGLVVANCASGVVQGDTLLASGTEGQLRANPDSVGREVDVDGTTDQGLYAPLNYAKTDSGGSWPLDGSQSSLGSNEAVIMVQ